MNVYVSDHQTVSDVSGTLFTLVQASTLAQVTLQNTGANTINYRFQELVGSTWTDMALTGTDLYNTLTANQVRLVLVTSSQPQVRLIGNASGGSTLDFSVSRIVTRTSGGPVPLLNY